MTAVQTTLEGGGQRRPQLDLNRLRVSGAIPTPMRTPHQPITRRPSAADISYGYREYRVEDGHALRLSSLGYC
jgi:hypothetical protein